METSGYFKVSMVVDTNATAKQHPALQKDSHLQARPETTGPEALHFSPTTASASTFLPIPPLPPFQSLFLTLTQMWGKNWEDNGLFWLWWKFWNSSSIKIVITGIFGAISRDKCFHKQESQGKKWAWVCLEQQSAHKFGASPDAWTYCTLQVLFHPRPKKVAPITGACPKGCGDIDSNIFTVWF